jgi:hypothetical protein
MNTLRDKVAEKIQAAAGENWNIAPLSDEDAEYLADNVLAIPDIAEALAIIPPGPSTATKQERTEIIRRVNDAFGATGL